MSTLNKSFTLTIGGTPISKPFETNESRTYAIVGSVEPAVFTLNDGLLESGDFFLGRHLVEDRSLLPKPLFWFPKGGEDKEYIHRTEVEELEDDHLQVKNGGAHLFVDEGRIYANLLGDDIPSIRVNWL
ncbi:hypothetical protein ASPWEDRAFT_41644 [Aspergillus wentii DTO 134E9]|uniref:Uncharacterized protein n=1 Tax=Aspergillus wentii DTO 134E9 TaxID=1073089 RepID=A0A1L9RFY2_ASPWE|nr:uncharacterized protein ASPWEDRAFT_41644 [Aspergillus wentii DTO 134E9]KAI9925536.1 hypothetical protein MW887_005917 [Aspergillus wentii]OJJ33778.1 hypothetical protein ASPWEDRAFT_41644 [Aspergillus wentii DTO 134E9]